MIDHNKEILIGKRSKASDHFPNYWDLPGGKIEAGEKAEEALIQRTRGRAFNHYRGKALKTFSVYCPSLQRFSSTDFGI